MKTNRVCLLCGKALINHQFVANNNRHGWTFAHTICRQEIIMAQQNAVLNAILAIGAKIRRR